MQDLDSSWAQDKDMQSKLKDERRRYSDLESKLKEESVHARIKDAEKSQVFSPAITSYLNMYIRKYALCLIIINLIISTSEYLISRKLSRP